MFTNVGELLFRYYPPRGTSVSFYDFVLFCFKIDLALTNLLIVESLFDQVHSITISRRHTNQISTRVCALCKEVPKLKK